LVRLPVVVAARAGSFVPPEHVSEAKVGDEVTEGEDTGGCQGRLGTYHWLDLHEPVF
jgi:hypothetical protein